MATAHPPPVVADGDALHRIGSNSLDVDAPGARITGILQEFPKEDRRPSPVPFGFPNGKSTKLCAGRHSTTLPRTGSPRHTPRDTAVI